ncbi:hypothetical protein Sjap_008618 [Stephania japonica]|uniref:RRM domain-containing protein n=1 Tax=Stephania japonica TaxID=461633 RepID=A0AAP0PCI3_9MAGN
MATSPPPISMALHFHTHSPITPTPTHCSLLTTPQRIITFSISTKPHHRTPITKSTTTHFSPTPRSAQFDGFEVESSEDEDKDENEDEKDGVLGGGTSRLFVGNLPFTMSPSQIKEVFAEAGRVASVEVIYDRVTDRSRGFAFVTMGSAEHAEEAIRMFDGSQIGGRTVKVNFPEVPRGGEREIMGPTTRNSNRQALVDTPYKLYWQSWMGPHFSGPERCLQ